mgnify:CR=1 FL=1
MGENIFNVKFKNTRLRKIAKNIALASLISYFGWYTAGSGYAISDYHNGHKQWLERNIKNELDIRTASITINNRVEEIVFVGENHRYNIIESEFAKDFVKDFDLILSEGKAKSTADLEEIIYSKILWSIGKVPYYFYDLAHSRSPDNNGLLESAIENKQPFLLLENELNGHIGGFSFKQRAELLSYFIEAALTAPYLYPKFKEDIKQNVDPTKYLSEDPTNDYANYKNRDYNMINNMLKYLTYSNPKKTLVIVGKLHLDGMLEYLSSIDSLNFKEKDL